MKAGKRNRGASIESLRVPHPLRSLQRVGYAKAWVEMLLFPSFAKSAKHGPPGVLSHVIPSAPALFNGVQKKPEP
jgi:hypothetical protein